MGSRYTPCIKSQTSIASFHLPWASHICSSVLHLLFCSETLRAKCSLCDPCCQCGVINVVNETRFGSRSWRENVMIWVGFFNHLNCLLKGIAAGFVFVISSMRQPYLLLRDLTWDCPKSLKGLELLSWLSFKPRLWLREFFTTRQYHPSASGQVCCPGCS